MNATEMGRRSDSLYYDNVSRRELCDRIAHLESDLEDAKGKNADVWGSLKARETRLAFLIDDNAKLRKLCADFYKFSDSMCTQFNDCSHCRFMGEDGVNCKNLELFQRICKLRIEVEV